MTPLTPPNPPITFNSILGAGSQGVGIATLIFRYFLRYFSSAHRTDLSRFRGSFHSFDPVGFAIFANSRARRRAGPSITVCVLPGTEIAFATPVRCLAYSTLFGWKRKVFNHKTAIFRQVNKDNPRKHHDALEFPDGQMVLLTLAFEGQEATVLQLPAQPVTAADIKTQELVSYAG